MTNEELAPQAECMRALAECAVKWGWNEEEFIRVATFCFRWERDGKMPTSLEDRGILINAKASAGAHLVDATEALRRARGEDEKAAATLRVTEAAAELERATKALEAAGER